MKQKMKWVSKYISRPLLILMLIAFLVYKFSPDTYQKLGIDINTLGKFAFLFFLIKGILWLVAIAYAVYYWRKNKSQK
jgi:formate hydrogenlyase subunit 3/multisubunit Na+/H+ antiporter MnhD subunit